jgi:hypothetical protein
MIPDLSARKRRSMGFGDDANALIQQKKFTDGEVLEIERDRNFHFAPPL